MATGETLYNPLGIPFGISSLLIDIKSEDAPLLSCFLDFVASLVKCLSQADLNILTIAAFTHDVSSQSFAPFAAKLQNGALKKKR